MFSLPGAGTGGRSPSTATGSIPFSLTTFSYGRPHKLPVGALLRPLLDAAAGPSRSIMVLVLACTAPRCRDCKRSTSSRTLLRATHRQLSTLCLAVLRVCCVSISQASSISWVRCGFDRPGVPFATSKHGRTAARQSHCAAVVRFTTVALGNNHSWYNTVVPTEHALREGIV